MHEWAQALAPSQPGQASPQSNHRTNPVVAFSLLVAVVQEPPPVVAVQSFHTMAVERWEAVRMWKLSLVLERVAVR